MQKTLFFFVFSVETKPFPWQDMLPIPKVSPCPDGVAEEMVPDLSSVCLVCLVAVWPSYIYPLSGWDGPFGRPGTCTNCLAADIQNPGLSNPPALQSLLQEREGCSCLVHFLISKINKISSCCGIWAQCSRKVSELSVSSVNILPSQGTDVIQTVNLRIFETTNPTAILPYRRGWGSSMENRGL